MGPDSPLEEVFDLLLRFPRSPVICNREFGGYKLARQYSHAYGGVNINTIATNHSQSGLPRRPSRRPDIDCLHPIAVIEVRPC